MRSKIEPHAADCTLSPPHATSRSTLPRIGNLCASACAHMSEFHTSSRLSLQCHGSTHRICYPAHLFLQLTKISLPLTYVATSPRRLRWRFATRVAACCNARSTISCSSSHFRRHASISSSMFAGHAREEFEIRSRIRLAVYVSTPHSVHKTLK